MHSGKTPSSSLSPTAQRLLTEFGLRYGVVSKHIDKKKKEPDLIFLFALKGELYRRIVYLEYLAK